MSDPLSEPSSVKLPALIDMFPERVLAPERVSVPEPALVMPPEPKRRPAKLPSVVWFTVRTCAEAIETFPPFEPPPERDPIVSFAEM